METQESESYGSGKMEDFKIVSVQHCDRCDARKPKSSLDWFFEPTGSVAICPKHQTPYERHIVKQDIKREINRYNLEIASRKTAIEKHQNSILKSKARISELELILKGEK